MSRHVTPILICVFVGVPACLPACLPARLPSRPPAWPAKIHRLIVYAQSTSALLLPGAPIAPSRRCSGTANSGPSSMSLLEEVLNHPKPVLLLRLALAYSLLEQYHMFWSGLCTYRPAPFKPTRTRRTEKDSQHICRRGNPGECIVQVWSWGTGRNDHTLKTSRGKTSRNMKLERPKPGKAPRVCSSVT